MIVRGGALAEFVLTCPVFTALRAQFPETAIEVLGYLRVAQIAKAAGLADEVHSIETRAAAGFFARQGVLDSELSKFFGDFSIIFSYLYDPDGFFQANVKKVSQAQFIVGPARPDEGKTIHATDHFLQPLERLAIFDAERAPRLVFPEGKSNDGVWIAVHADGDHENLRNWSAMKWRALIETILAKTSYRVMLIAGDGESRNVDQMAQNFSSERISVLKEAPFSEVASRLAGCHAFIGHDSGISYLAAATGIPSIVLWSAKNRAIWQPLGKNVTLLWARQGANGISQEEVLAALPRVWAGAE